MNFNSLGALRPDDVDEQWGVTCGDERGMQDKILSPLCVCSFDATYHLNTIYVAFKRSLWDG